MYFPSPSLLIGCRAGGDASTWSLSQAQDPIVAASLSTDPLHVPENWRDPFSNIAGLDQETARRLSLVARGRIGYENIGSLRTKPGK